MHPVKDFSFAEGSVSGLDEVGGGWGWAVTDISLPGLLTGTENLGLFTWGEDWCSMGFMLVVEFMVVSGQDSASEPIPRQEKRIGFLTKAFG